MHLVSITNGEIQPQQRYLCSCTRRCFWKFHPCARLSSAALRVPPVVLFSEQPSFRTCVTPTAAASPPSCTWRSASVLSWHFQEQYVKVTKKRRETICSLTSEICRFCKKILKAEMRDKKVFSLFFSLRGDIRSWF